MSKNKTHFVIVHRSNAFCRNEGTSGTGWLCPQKPFSGNAPPYQPPGKALLRARIRFPVPKKLTSVGEITKRFLYPCQPIAGSIRSVTVAVRV
ncbi:MAG: hypothetical protein AB1595_03015 [bacterium]